MLAHGAGGPIWKATAVMVVYRPQIYAAEFYVYAGPDACLVDEYVAGDVASIEDLFRAAGLPSPIGATFYALPPI